MTWRPATVERWDDGGGSARQDDGGRVLLPPDVLAGGHLRTLRAGQRLEVQLIDGAVAAVRLPGN